MSKKDQTSANGADLTVTGRNTIAEAMHRAGITGSEKGAEKPQQRNRNRDRRAKQSQPPQRQKRTGFKPNSDRRKVQTSSRKPIGNQLEVRDVDSLVVVSVVRSAARPSERMRGDFEHNYENDAEMRASRAYYIIKADRSLAKLEVEGREGYFVAETEIYEDDPARQYFVYDVRLLDWIRYETSDGRVFLFERIGEDLFRYTRAPRPPRRF